MKRGSIRVKNVKHRNAILVITAIIYSVVAFMIPMVKGFIFWISYIFTMLAILIQLYVIHRAFDAEESYRSKFYGIPIARVGLGYFMTQIIFGLLFMFLSRVIPAWIPITVYVIILGIAAIGLVTTDMVRNEVQRQDIKTKGEIANIRVLQSRLSIIIAQVQDDALRKELKKFADELRYSDPVSSEILEKVENDLISHIDELQKAVLGGDYAYASAICQNAFVILAKRNELCKMNK